VIGTLLWAVRRSQGVDVRLAATEIPPGLTEDARKFGCDSSMTPFSRAARRGSTTWDSSLGYPRRRSGEICMSSPNRGLSFERVAAPLLRLQP